MTLVRSLFVILLLFVSSGARAAVQCDALLSQASPVVRDYVNLIKYHVKHSGGALDAKISEEILRSESFTNPFAGGPDSVSVLLTRAMNKIKNKITIQDWQQIKEAVKALALVDQEVQVDRQEKKTETSWIFDPHIAHEDAIHPITDARTQWLRINSRVLYATTEKVDGRLSVYEMINGTSKLIGHSEEQHKVSGRITWQVVGDRLLLAVSSGLSGVYIFECMSDHINLVASMSFAMPVYAALQWQIIDERIYLAVSANKPYVYELIGNRLEVRSHVETTLPTHASISWQVVGDRVLLAVGVYNNLLRIYKFEYGQLELVAEFNEKTRASSAPSWQVIDDRVYIAIASDMNRAYLFELVGDSLELREKHELSFTAHQPSFWVEKNGRHFLVLAGWHDIKIFELAEGKLMLRGQFFVDERINTAAIDLGEDQDRMPVRFTTDENNILVIELFNELEK